MATTPEQWSARGAYLAAVRQLLSSAATIPNLAALTSRVVTLEANDAAMIGSVNSIASSLGALAGRVSTEEGKSTAMSGQISTLDANMLKRVALPDWNVVIASGLLVTLAAGNRTYTVAVPASYAVKAGDPIFVSPKAAVLAGYIVGAASAPADNQLQVQIGNPLIAIGANVSILLSVFTIRP